MMDPEVEEIGMQHVEVLPLFAKPVEKYPQEKYFLFRDASSAMRHHASTMVAVAQRTHGKEVLLDYLDKHGYHLTMEKQTLVGRRSRRSWVMRNCPSGMP